MTVVENRGDLVLGRVRRTNRFQITTPDEVEYGWRSTHGPAEVFIGGLILSWEAFQRLHREFSAHIPPDPDLG